MPVPDINAGAWYLLPRPAPEPDGTADSEPGSFGWYISPNSSPDTLGGRRLGEVSITPSPATTGAATTGTKPARVTAHMYDGSVPPADALGAVERFAVGALGFTLG